MHAQLRMALNQIKRLPSKHKEDKVKRKTLFVAVLSLAGAAFWLFYAAPQPIAASISAPVAAPADSSGLSVATGGTELQTAATKTAAPATQLAPVTVSQACLTADEFKNTFSALQQQRFLLSQQLTNLHQQLGIEKSQTLELLQAYGGDLEWYQFYQASHKNKHKNNYPFFKPAEPYVPMPDITMTDYFRLKLALSNADYQDILAFLQEQPEENRHLLYQDGQLSFLLQIIAKNPDLPFGVLQQLIDAGLRPFFADFAVMTTLDLPLPLIAMVQQHYAGDLNEQWRDNYRQYNLTLLAAENQNATLFDYWLALGIPAELGKHEPNAFDLIPLPGNETELHQQLPKIRTLLNATIAPRSADLQSQWLLLLPDAEKELLLSILQQQAATITTIDANSNSPDAAMLQALQQVQQQFAALLAQFARCPADILAPDTKWQLTHQPDRALPERRFPKMIARLQQGMSKEQATDTKRATELMLQKNWVLLEQMMQEKGDKQQAEIDIILLQAMVIGSAETEVIRRQMTKIPELPAKELQIFSIITTPEQRSIFKAAGFALEEKTK
jgi:hypothetical protein